jgi:hypothetical protein
MIYLGIDAGLTGAIAAIYPDKRVSVVDIPIQGSGRDGINRIDGLKLAYLLRDLVSPKDVCVAWIEEIIPRPVGNAKDGGERAGNSMQSQGSLMRTVGSLETACAILRIPLRTVYPQKWKRTLRLLGKPKEDSVKLALELFPILKDSLALKKHHNRAEAVLIAEYGRRTQQ